MILLQRCLRAEYLWRPSQPFRRLWRTSIQRDEGFRKKIKLPWGLPIWVDPTESIGRSIVALSILDLPVTEAIWRLLDREEHAADVGANIGYMTSVMADRLGKGSAIHCFEPVPVLAAQLRVHVSVWQEQRPARIHVHAMAATDGSGQVRLHLPRNFAANHGRASLLQPAPAPNCETPASTLAVPGCRLDDVLPLRIPLGLMKLDVEGAEYRALQGAERLLSTGRVRDVVLEEHGGPDAASLGYLRGFGYSLFRVVRSWTGPRLVAVDSLCQGELDPPTYLATLDARRAQRRFLSRGWRSLR